MSYAGSRCKRDHVCYATVGSSLTTDSHECLSAPLLRECVFRAHRRNDRTQRSDRRVGIKKTQFPTSPLGREILRVLALAPTPPSTIRHARVSAELPIAITHDTISLTTGLTARGDLERGGLPGRPGSVKSARQSITELGTIEDYHGHSVVSEEVPIAASSTMSLALPQCRNVMKRQLPRACLSHFSRIASQTAAGLSKMDSGQCLYPRSIPLGAVSSPIENRHTLASSASSSVNLGRRTIAWLIEVESADRGLLESSSKHVLHSQADVKHRASQFNWWI